MTAGIMPRTPPPSMLSMVITFPLVLGDDPCVEAISDNYGIFLIIQMVVHKSMYAGVRKEVGWFSLYIEHPEG